MRSIDVKILKNKLSEYVRLAARGEIVLVTDRDRVVAELGPPAYGLVLYPSDAALAELVGSGALTVPLSAGAAPPARLPVAHWKQLAGELQDDRSER
jgi:antitoxin (DNA-binding transcriptional repressor) of toxin-antitoxin stability system